MRPLTVGGLLHQATVPPSSRNAAVRRWSVRRPHVHSLFMLNVGLVGFGFAGKVFHAPVIRAVAGLRLDAIVQRHGTPDPGYAGGDFVTLQRLVSDGTLGRIVTYESHFDRFRPDLKPGAWRERPEPGAGVWFDLGPHLLDQAFVLFGTPRAVAADIRSERDGALVDDAFDVTLHYPTLRA